MGFVSYLSKPFSMVDKRWGMPAACLLVSLGLGCSSSGTDNELPQSSGVPSNLSSPDYERKIERTIYGGIGLGISQLEPDTSEVPGWDVDDPNNFGKQITLGADLSRQLSVELHRSELGSAGLTPLGRISYDITAASALLYAGKNRHKYRRRGLTGYGRIGVGRLENKPIGAVNYQKDNATHVLYGLGVEYMMRVGLGVRAEVVSYDKDVRYGQLGLIYRFGRNEKRQSEPYIAQTPAPMPVAPPVPAVAIDPCAKLDGVLNGVNFHTDSAQLVESAKTKLDDIAVSLKRCADTSVVISGHTDNVGSARYNQQLSHRRVNSVMKYLNANGIQAGRLKGKAYGETQPIAANNSAEGRKFNRRVEMAIIK